MPQTPPVGEPPKGTPPPVGQPLSPDDIARLGTEAPGEKPEEVKEPEAENPPAEPPPEEGPKVPEPVKDDEVVDTLFLKNGRGEYEPMSVAEVVSQSDHFIKHHGQVKKLDYEGLIKLAQAGFDASRKYAEAKRLQESSAAEVEQRARLYARQLFEAEIARLNSEGQETPQKPDSRAELEELRREFKEELQKRDLADLRAKNAMEVNASKEAAFKAYQERFKAAENGDVLFEAFDVKVNKRVAERVEDLYEERGRRMVPLEEFKEILEEELKANYEGFRKLLPQAPPKKPSAIPPVVKSGGAAEPAAKTFQQGRFPMSARALTKELIEDLGRIRPGS